jgi:hypothetical protein
MISRVKKQNKTNLSTFDNPCGFVQTAYTVANGHASRKGSTLHSSFFIKYSQLFSGGAKLPKGPHFPCPPPA